MADTGTTAVVGVAGGAGATRLTVEAAATLARAGREVAVFDADFATQGLADYVPGSVDPDVTRALLEPDLPLSAIATELPWETPGRAVACPARAPFERFARAGTAGAAEALCDRLASAAERYDAVLVDAPPVATNVAVAAVTEADRVALVVPPGERGTTATQRVRDRLADVGAAVDAVVANRVDAARREPGVDADATVPVSDVRAPSAAPAALDPDAEFAPAVARGTEAMVGEPLDLAFERAGMFDGVL